MDRRILFSGPMICAILVGRKTQTRRVITRFPRGYDQASTGGARVDDNGGWRFKAGKFNVYSNEAIGCPYGMEGDHLIVKEAAWMWCEKRPNGKTKLGRPKFRYVPLDSAPVIYCADHPNKPQTDVVSPVTRNEWGWRKKIGRFLPRWASRLTLEITDVQVPRVQDISDKDASAEGCQADETGFVKEHFADLWDSFNKKRGFGWDKDPWVWAINFKVV